MAIGALALVSALGPELRADQSKVANTERYEVNEAQSLKKEWIQVGPEKIQVELALTPKEQSKGLMFRHELAEESGMLFVFKDERPLNFWMKNTFIPLSIGYFDAKGKLIDIQEMRPVTSEMETPSTYPSHGPASFALEMNPGWFEKHHIKVGALLKRAVLKP
jgi:uncharacterized membrane protein (UPF0127 family)